MLDQKRAEEAAVYVGQYLHDSYRMGLQRQIDVHGLLTKTTRGSLLDVGTGRGETLAFALLAGFAPVMGTETVPELLNDRTVFAYSVSLPFADGEFDVVTCFDVMEHLIEEDLVPTIQELCRVAKREVIISWSEIPSSEWGGGRDLHISRRTADEAEALIKHAAPGWKIQRDGTAGGSPVFRITK